MADTDALGYMQSGTNVCTIPPILSTSAATLKVNGMIVTSKMQDVLQDASGCVDIQNYAQIKTRWVPEMMDWVWWQAIGSAFDSLSLRNKIRALKCQHNWLPTMAHLHSLYPSESPFCPICAEANEDWRHLINLIIYKVEQWLGIPETPPRIPRDKLGDYLTDSVST
eukprot:5131225-Ditylum_brightwellii.AAC.4